MIKNIIFDFGDVFLNLDKGATTRAMQAFGSTAIKEQTLVLCHNYEKGLLTSDIFLTELKKEYPKANLNQLEKAWNAIILDLPEDRLHFLENLANTKKYRLFLLSNTNSLHLTYVQNTIGKERYLRFTQAFEHCYFSHVMHKRKPDFDIYEQVLREKNLRPQETFFVDDTKENTQAAKLLGMHTWHLQVGLQNITQLFEYLP